MAAPKKDKQLRELDTERIASAAMTVIDALGVSGFTMRAVAKALGVTPMALYHHVGDKAGLATLLVDAAVREVPLPPATGEWREDLWAMANWMRQMTLAHPAVSHLRREYAIWTPTILQLSERWLGLWQQSGLGFDRAVLAAISSSKAITGLVGEEILLSEIPLPDEETLSMLPNVRAIYSKDRDPFAEFELAVRSLIDGIHSRLSGS